jgi:hypothetical protein
VSPPESPNFVFLRGASGIRPESLRPFGDCDQRLDDVGMKLRA